MKVLFFATIREYTRTKEIDFEYCNNVGELLHKLGNRYGSKLAAKLLKDGDLGDEIIILVNGRNIINMDGINTPLNNDDTISIFPVVAGG